MLITNIIPCKSGFYKLSEIQFYHQLSNKTKNRIKIRSGFIIPQTAIIDNFLCNIFYNNKVKNIHTI